MKKLLSFIFILSVLACSSNNIGTGVGNPPNTTAAAVAALFSTQSNSNLSQLEFKVIVQENVAPCTEGTNCTCDLVVNDNNPNITNSFSNIAGTYGAVGFDMTVTEDDFCQDSEGNDNTGNGPDGFGIFAGFEITGVVQADCTDSEGEEITVQMKSGSEGIWRRSIGTEERQSYRPEVYGQFVFDVNGEEVTMDCTLQMDTDETTALLFECSLNGELIEQDSSANCTIDTE